VIALFWFLHGWCLNVLLHGPRKATSAEIVAAQAAGDGDDWFALTEMPQSLGVTRTVITHSGGGPVRRYEVRTTYLFYVLPGPPSMTSGGKQFWRNPKPGTQGKDA
jgi:hypothetical protein